eukprot:XP_008178557.1 PREDICTED: cylicin-1-like isoform X2 [Acyrthosiphon pisum]
MNYHGTPETKDDMEKKDAMDTYNLALSNDMDDVDDIDGEQYSYDSNNPHSIEIPFYWVIDVNGRKHKKKYPHAHLRKSRDVNYKKTHHKSPAKSSKNNDHELENHLKKKEKRSRYKKLNDYKHDNEELVKHLKHKVGKKTNKILKDESRHRLSKDHQVLTSKKSKKPSSHKIRKRSSKILTDTTIDNMSTKDSNELNKKVSKITGSSSEDSSNSDKDIKNVAKIHSSENSNKKTENISKNQPKLETHNELDKTS